MTNDNCSHNGGDRGGDRWGACDSYDSGGCDGEVVAVRVVVVVMMAIVVVMVKRWWQ